MSTWKISHHRFGIFLRKLHQIYRHLPKTPAPEFWFQSQSFHYSSEDDLCICWYTPKICCIGKWCLFVDCICNIRENCSEELRCRTWNSLQAVALFITLCGQWLIFAFHFRSATQNPFTLTLQTLLLYCVPTPPGRKSRPCERDMHISTVASERRRGGDRSTQRRWNRWPTPSSPVTRAGVIYTGRG